MVRRVLFVGGGPEVFSQLGTTLQKEPYELLHLRDAEEAREAIAAPEVKVVVALETGPGMQGVQLLRDLLQRRRACLRILLTSGSDRSSLVDAVNEAEVFRILTLPLSPAALARVLREALRVSRVMEAQEAIWAAARLQQEALGRLSDPEDAVSGPEAEEALTGARFAGFPPRKELSDESVGELPDEHASRLSQREKEIVEALGAGRRVKDIARDLVISTHTVRNHLKAIYRKLNVRSQFELISLMARHSRDS